ncbi:MAG: hypothetical protein HY550_01915 [Elusimicrobia bacterium]|nr:hypothetical protein [Elusimicrobiota bacterium]
MKRSALIASALLSVSALSAAELNTISAVDIRISKPGIPVPVLQAGEAGNSGFVSGEIADLHLLARASKNVLFTYAKTDAQFREFTDKWTPILGKFGIKVTGTEYKNEFGILRYESPDGRVIRDFMADGLHYDALSSTTIARLQHELLEPLERKGLTPIASFTIKNEVFRPTFSVYYLTRPEENMDHEVQLRQLKNGEDIDFDLLANAVTLVRKDASFSMVYIGKLLGFKSKLATDTAAAAAGLEKYKTFLAENNKEFIASRTIKMNEPFTSGDHTFNYVLNMYFFQ